MIGAAFAVTAVVYLGLAAATVSALGAGSPAPLADLLALGLGRAGAVAAAGGAVILTLGTVSAYVTGGAALARTLTADAGDGVPAWFTTSIVLTGVAELSLIAEYAVLPALLVAVIAAIAKRDAEGEPRRSTAGPVGARRW